MSVSVPRYSLEALDARANATAPEKNEMKSDKDYKGYSHYGRKVWVWLLVIFLVVLLVLWLLQPSFVLSRRGKHGPCCLDWCKLLLWALVIALAIVLLLWLLSSMYHYDKKESC